jgi:hypothetical protein
MLVLAPLRGSSAHTNAGGYWACTSMVIGMCAHPMHFPVRAIQLTLSYWCPRHDLNTGPPDYKSGALPTELQGQGIGIPFISLTDSDGIAEAWRLFITNTADDWWGFKDPSPLIWWLGQQSTNHHAYWPRFRGLLLRI